MTRSQAPWAILVAALLASCADDSARLAGGTGSDLPRPVARLLDTSLAPVDAKVWRLWKVVGDTAYPDTQIVNLSGFSVPPSGLWIVEAWSDTVHSGSLAGLKKAWTHDTISSCAQHLTRIPGLAETQVGVQPCLWLAPPSRASRDESPVGVGVFGSQQAIQRIIRIPGQNYGRGSFRFVVWRITDSIKDGQAAPPTSVDSNLMVFHKVQYSPIRGTVDVTVPEGRWLFEGWSFDPVNNDTIAWEKTIPQRRFASDAELAMCVEDPEHACPGQPARHFSEADASEVFFHVQAP